jgi:hypothetical protein
MKYYDKTKVVVTFLNRYIRMYKIQFSKLNNFTKGLVVDTLQPQLFLFLLTAIPDQNRSIQMRFVIY